jgi:hypothetical protein
MEGSVADRPGWGGVGAGSTGVELVTGDWLSGTVPGVVAGAPASAGAAGTVAGVVRGIVDPTGDAADGAVVATGSVAFVPAFVGPEERSLRATPMMIRPQTMTATAHGAERTQAQTREAGLASTGGAGATAVRAVWVRSASRFG